MSILEFRGPFGEVYRLSCTSRRMERGRQLQGRRAATVLLRSNVAKGRLARFLDEPECSGIRPGIDFEGLALHHVVRLLEEEDGRLQLWQVDENRPMSADFDVWRSAPFLADLSETTIADLAKTTIANPLDVPAHEGFLLRLRISSWVNNTDLLFLEKPAQKTSKPVMTKNAKGKEALNLMQQAKGLVDDFTIQRTINNNKEMEVSWDPLGRNADPEVCKAFYQAVVAECHNNEIQCLLSYTMMAPSEGPSRFHTFNDWLTGRNFEKLTPEKHAENIMEFLDENVPECDGLSVDIEGLHTGFGVTKDMSKEKKEAVLKDKEDMLKKMLERYQRFLGKLAELLAAQKKILGVATAGLTSETEVTPGFTAEDGFRLHQYTLAKGHPNMLIRSMIYDNYKINGDMSPNMLEKALATTLSLQDKAIAYAKTVIPMAQFQVGIKTIPGLKKYGGFITDVQLVRRRCEELLRPDGVGLALFPTSVRFWKECNAGLNMRAPLAAQYGHPVQAPLHKHELERFPFGKIFGFTNP